MEPNPKLLGTIYTAAAEIEAAGGKALPLVCDIRSEAQVHLAYTIAKYGTEFVQFGTAKDFRSRDVP